MTLVEEWAEELSSILNRSAEDIRKDGLRADDFPAIYDLGIEFADGSRLEFKFAFYAVREALRQIAVFTEHCGYHVFPSHGATITRISREWVYLDNS